MKIASSAYPKAGRAKNIFWAVHKNDPLEKEEFFSHLPAAVRSATRTFARTDFRADEGNVQTLWFAEGAVRRLCLLGLGERSSWHARKAPLAARICVRHAKSERIEELTAILPPGSDGKKDTVAQYAANALMADFEFNAYKQKPKDGWPEIRTLRLAGRMQDMTIIKTGICEGSIIGEEVNNCRHLANTPGSEMTPAILAAAARSSARNKKIRVRVMEEDEMKRLCMGGILGVSAGSDEKPKLIILEYRAGPKNQKPLVIAGKGVTFDSGGLNIKPHPHMYEMHMDMSGGAAVIHGIAAMARLGIAVNAVGIIPAVENMPSGSSYRPGDLLKTHSGKVIEVLNTDAEGRVILADALSYGAKKYKPGLLIDFATLTGAAHSALGNYCSALFTQDEKLQQKLFEIGQTSGDYVWPLPLWDEYLPDIKATFGDLANISPNADRSGGAIHGAKFLEQFAEGARFAHIDIAPRMTTAESDRLAKGASGVGVRYIVELAKNYASIMNQES